ncbi:MAG: DoxX family protein [Deltaproteobacteria bacterium]|nr:DoxX family protein [Deltaproteobacteria bacterium]
MENLLSKFKLFLFSGETISSNLANGCLLIARFGLGGMMAFAHGLGKLPPSEGFIAAVSALGFPLPVLFAWVAGLSEFVGSLAVSLGIATRLSALMVSVTMLVAAFGRHFSDPFEKKEMALVYLCGFLLCAAVGSGRYSIDYFLRKRIEP